jgi:hypothetical protein
MGRFEPRAERPGGRSSTGALRRDRIAGASPTARAVAPPSPDALGPDAIASLQRAVGNAGVTAYLENADAQQSEAQEPDAAMAEPGRALDPAIRGEMEAALGADFASVRVHDGATAAASAHALGARAYTVGEHIVVGSGGTDRQTMAHELTHVVQQRSGPVDGTPTGSGFSVSDPGDRFERDASAAAASIAGAGGGLASGASGAGGGPGLAGAATAQRAADDDDGQSVQRAPEDEQPEDDTAAKAAGADIGASALCFRPDSSGMEGAAAAGAQTEEPHMVMVSASAPRRPPAEQATYSSVPDPDVPGVMDVARTEKTGPGSTMTTSTSITGMMQTEVTMSKGPDQGRDAGGDTTAPTGANPRIVPGGQVVGEKSDPGGPGAEARVVSDDLDDAIAALQGDRPDYRGAFGPLRSAAEGAGELMSSLEGDPRAHDQATFIAGAVWNVAKDVFRKGGSDWMQSDAENVSDLASAREHATTLVDIVEPRSGR